MAQTGIRKVGHAWQASVYDARDRRKIRRNFRTVAAARAWRADATRALHCGELRAGSRETVRQAAERLTVGMESGVVRNRAGDAYKPSVVRSYEQALRLHVLPDLGALKVGDVRRRDVQAVADRLLAAGMSPSTIRNALLPLRVVYRRLVEDGDVASSPVAGVRLPAVRGRRERVAAPSEAAALIEALPQRDRAVWATAMYAGLRLGELRALRWGDVDFTAGVIRVERGMDHKGGIIQPKSRAGRRVVPIAPTLRAHLAAHRLLTVGDGLVFGRTPDRPFNPTTINLRAGRAWKTAKLTPIGLHECRHSFASLLIAAGVNARAISTYLGHASIQVTFDLYGHLMPGNESEAATLLEAFLTGTETGTRTTKSLQTGQ